MDMNRIQRDALRIMLAGGAIYGILYTIDLV